MKYLLTPDQLSFKEAVRRFMRPEAFPLAKEISSDTDGKSESLAGIIEEGLQNIMAGMTGQEEDKLSGVNSVLALEEVLRRLPAVQPQLAESRFFSILPPELRRAASFLGAAQGRLVPYLDGLRLGHDSPSADSLPEITLARFAQLVSEIESVRLMVYRAAILEDQGKSSAEESARAEGLARELAGRASGLSADITKGRSHET